MLQKYANSIVIGNIEMSEKIFRDNNFFHRMKAYQLKYASQYANMANQESKHAKEKDHEGS